MKINETKYLKNVNSVADLQALELSQLPAYCAELREFIISEVSANPGHLGASLGTVELAVALHYVYDAPHDSLVWDVGHQAYAHKIITGRRDLFHTNRKLGGISGFPKMSESEYDSFGGGHSSTSISAALGLAIAHPDRKSVAIIGDGAMSGGLAFEGLNNAGASSSDLLVVLNDNNISIDPNVGALKEALLEITTSRRYNNLKERTWNALGRFPRLRRILQKIGNGAKSFFLHQSNLFESFNFRYFGPVDGNDVLALVRTLRDLRQISGPKLLHILTVKGKGYAPAEQSQTEWHAPGKFNPSTGEKEPADGHLRFQEIFGQTLLELARRDERIVGITPAMTSGCSMNILMEALPAQAYDVGIAEGHAVTFAAALAAGGKIPFCNIYSSFMQRAVDNIIHDAAIQGLDLTLCLDRAGLVGEDGATHHGVFDIALLRSIPGVTIAAPADAAELRAMMLTASKGGCGVFVIRYPRGGCFTQRDMTPPVEQLETIEIGRARLLSETPDAQIALLSLGAMAPGGAEAVARAAKSGVAIDHYDLRFAKPLDESLLHDIAKRYRRIVTLEDGVLAGGVGSAVLEFMADNGYQVQVTRLGLPDRFVEHGTVAQLRGLCGLDVDSLTKTLCAMAQ